MCGASCQSVCPLTCRLSTLRHFGCFFCPEGLTVLRNEFETGGRRRRRSAEGERLESEVAVLSRWHHLANSEKWKRSRRLM